MSFAITVGGTQQLTIAVFDEFSNILTDRTATWSSSNTSVATVSGTGLVTGTGAGSCTISATVDGVTGQTSATVTPISVLDSFDRANNSSSLGTADSGQAWVALAGTWGILSNQAYLVSSTGNDMAYIDAGLSDCTVTAVIQGDVDAHWRIAARIIDVLNALVLTVTATSLTIFRVTAGGGSAIANATGLTVTVGDRLGIDCRGSDISIVQNGNTLVTASETQGQLSTKHGLQADATALGRWNDFRQDP